MISKSQSKYIRSLALQKFRKQHGHYVVEGEKIVAEYLKAKASFQYLIITNSFFNLHQQLVQGCDVATLITVEEKELAAISGLQSASQALAVVELPNNNAHEIAGEWAIALEDIRDPGNMGSIIRIADWFGVQHLYASKTCVDFYNPKVIQAAMGGHLRVQLHEVDWLPFLSKQTLPLYATTLNGHNLFNFRERKKGIIVIGNEAHGLSDATLKHCKVQLSIPGQGGAESLNAAVAAGIVCAFLIEGK